MLASPTNLSISSLLIIGWALSMQERAGPNLFLSSIYNYHQKKNRITIGNLNCWEHET